MNLTGATNRMFCVPDIGKDQITAGALEELDKLNHLLCCRGEIKELLGNLKRKKPSPIVELHCAWCGGIIHKTENKAALSEKHYCNRGCANKGHRRRY